MYKLNLLSTKTAAIALTLASLSMTSTVQAHHDDGYLPLVPFILYNVITQPRHYSSRQHHHEHYQRPERHSHSHDGYSQRRPSKRHHRH